jgi:CheY-like chemotaxis protein
MSDAILLVDDDAVALRTVGGHLEQLGFEVARELDAAEPWPPATGSNPTPRCSTSACRPATDPTFSRCFASGESR